MLAVDLITTLMSALVAQGIKALLSPPDSRDDAGVALLSGAAEQIVRALLSTADATSRSLDRIESNVNALVLARHRDALNLGYRNLQAAESSFRSPADRARLLDLAVQEFTAAAVAAPGAEAAVTAELLAGVAWLARGSPLDFIECSRRASDVAFTSLLDAAHDFKISDEQTVFALEQDRSDAFGRLKKLLTDQRDEQKAGAIRAEVRGQALARRDDAAELFNHVQHFRRLHGAATKEQAPLLRGFWHPGVEGLSPTISTHQLSSATAVNSHPVLEPGEVLGQSVRIAASNVTSVRSGQHTGYVVDAAVHLALGGSGRVQATVGWPTMNFGSGTWDTSVNAEQVPYLPAQVGHRLWNGQRQDVINSPSELALRCTTTSLSDWLVVGVHGFEVSASRRDLHHYVLWAYRLIG
jgi:hypothetical protein